MISISPLNDINVDDCIRIQFKNLPFNVTENINNSSDDFAVSFVVPFGVIYFKETIYFIVWEIRFRDFFQEMKWFEMINRTHFEINKLMKSPQTIIAFNTNSKCSSILWELIEETDLYLKLNEKFISDKEIDCVNYFDYDYKWELDAIFVKNELFERNDEIYI